MADDPREGRGCSIAKLSLKNNKEFLRGLKDVDGMGSGHGMSRSNQFQAASTNRTRQPSDVIEDTIVVNPVAKLAKSPAASAGHTVIDPVLIADDELLLETEFGKAEASKVESVPVKRELARSRKTDRQSLPVIGSSQRVEAKRRTPALLARKNDDDRGEVPALLAYNDRGSEQNINAVTSEPGTWCPRIRSTSINRTSM